ncbi:MAG: DUF1360 domain-containing protein [Steroidobacteraceae bacterium]|nr:DUF1360 domain-containing protein [Steroidobacteraceae bacterium]
MSYQPEDLIACGVVGIAAAAISMSFTQGSMFEPIRSWIAARHALMGELARCFFCLSHWIAFAGIAIYRPRPLRGVLAADLVIAAFVAIAVATVVSGLMFAAFLAAGHTHALRERLHAKRQEQPVRQRLAEQAG